MELDLTNMAAARLHALLWEEKNRVMIHVVRLTSGCSTPSFGLEVIESRKNMRHKNISGITLVWYPEEESWMNGIRIDFSIETGNFIIDHPNPAFLTNCFLELQGDDKHFDQ